VAFSILFIREIIDRKNDNRISGIPDAILDLRWKIDFR